MWLKNPTRILITPHSQNNHCSWTSRLSPAHRAHHMQTVTYHNSSKTQHPRTTFWKTAWEPGQHTQSPETPELEPRSPDTLSLSPAPGQNMPRSPDTLSLSPASPLLSFSQKMEELVYAGTKLSASPRYQLKNGGPPTTKDCRLSSPASSCESSPTAATTQGPKPSSICCR